MDELASYSPYTWKWFSSLLDSLLIPGSTMELGLIVGHLFNYRHDSEKEEATVQRISEVV